MIDVEFYMAIHELKGRFLEWIVPGEQEEILAWLDSNRSQTPVVFNIESTNNCNRACPFCPRTTQMTRQVKTMNPDVFKRIAEQINLHPPKLWDKWRKFARKNYGIPYNEQSENAFFLYILPRVVVLHGYGDPLLDPHIPDYVGMLSARDVPTYFSCNPGNIRLDKTETAFANGLTYIKYSIDTLGEGARGKDAFARDYPLIMQVLDMRERRGYKTQVIITMIDTGGKAQEFERLKDAFKGTGVYIYLKSLDQAWMIGGEKPKAIHWSEPCQIPWSSMTINSSGLSVSCEEDYNGEIILGDAKIQSLAEIWNGEAYSQLRHKHIFNQPGIRCTDGRCDMKVFGRYFP